MAKITLKLNQNDLQEILRKGTALENLLTAQNGFIYSYMLRISYEYKDAVLSGIGKTSTGVLTLKDFLNSTRSVHWKPNAKRTIRRKAKNGWALTIWKASGETERAVKVYETSSDKSFTIFSGIDGNRDKEAYEHAVRTEFTATYGNINYDGRALFTLLNVILTDPATVSKLNKEIMAAIRDSIATVNWGS